MDFLNGWFHNLDPVVTFFRVLQGVIVALILWVLKILSGIGQKILRSGDKVKDLEAELKLAESKIVELSEDKHQQRLDIDKMWRTNNDLSKRLEVLEELVIELKAENKELRTKVAELEAINQVEPKRELV